MQYATFTDVVQDIARTFVRIFSFEDHDLLQKVSHEICDIFDGYSSMKHDDVMALAACLLQGEERWVTTPDDRMNAAGVLGRIEAKRYFNEDCSDIDDRILASTIEDWDLENAWEIDFERLCLPAFTLNEGEEAKLREAYKSAFVAEFTRLTDRDIVVD